MFLRFLRQFHKNVNALHLLTIIIMFSLQNETQHKRTWQEFARALELVVARVNELKHYVLVCLFVVVAYNNNNNCIIKCI